MQFGPNVLHKAMQTVRRWKRFERGIAVWSFDPARAIDKHTYRKAEKSGAKCKGSRFINSCSWEEAKE